MNRSLTILTLAAVFLSMAHVSNAEYLSRAKSADELKEEKIDRLAKLLANKFGATPRTCVKSAKIVHFNVKGVYCWNKKGETEVLLTSQDLKQSDFNLSAQGGTILWVYVPFLPASGDIFDLMKSGAIIYGDEADEAYLRADHSARVAALKADLKNNLVPKLSITFH